MKNWDQLSDQGNHRDKIRFTNMSIVSISTVGQITWCWCDQSVLTLFSKEIMKGREAINNKIVTTSPNEEAVIYWDFAQIYSCITAP